MLSFLRSATARRRDEARDLLRHTAKVLRYRNDVIAPAAIERINEAAGELRERIADKSTGEDALKTSFEKLDALLRRDGGKIYPLGAAADWTETFVIAAILAGGVRAFVFQPFKIPTNSMYPTYHGMTAKIYADNEPEPNVAQKFARKITLGASHLAPLAPVSGEILIPIGSNDISPPEKNKALDDGIFGTGILKGPADVHELFIGDTPASIVTPAEFSFKDALLTAFFPKEAALPVTQQERWSEVMRAARERGDLQPSPNGRGVLLRTRRTVAAGAPILRFDVLTGDMVFVDRMTCHFTGPKLGDAFVFRTALVPGMKKPDGTQPDDFYIKRLVGMPGDKLRVESGKLLRNDVSASGTVGFDFNNAGRRDLEYYGYTPDIGGKYPLFNDYTVPSAHYWAMGDNSANSSDSRAWGPVPEKAVVGRALFIIHPFGARWGRAK
jgi:signal peptidase I